MSKILLVLLCFFVTDHWSRARRLDDICASQNVRRVLLGSGESGSLTALNVSNGGATNVSLRSSCQVDIISCPSCSISLTFRFLNLSCDCGARFSLFLHNPCRCDYVWISEPPYEDSFGESFCNAIPTTGRDLGYKSKTRTVRVRLFFSRTYAHAFTLDYMSQPNRRFFFGTSQYPLGLNFSTGSISSPFFPAYYPPDLVSEYVLTCVKQSNHSPTDDGRPVDDDANCRVHLTFTDFQLASSSFVEFYEGSRRVGVVTGMSFRPPMIVTGTNSLMIRFCASGQRNLGFKAVFSFVSETIVKNMARPSTDCGGYVNNLGGTIAMMKMVESEVKLFDCIWLIKPLVKFSHVKTQLYLKVTTFRGFGGGAELEIRQGLTSESPVLEKVRFPVLQSFQEHVVPFQSGFYVSLRAVFGSDSYFAISYALFSHKRCVVLPGFICGNFRCISEKLTCDGFDHCGDNTDEPTLCYEGWESESGIGRSRSALQVPNYYFPKLNEYSVVKTASNVFLVTCLGLIFLLSSFAGALYLAQTKAQHETTLRNDLQAVNNFQDCFSDEVSVEDVVIDDPPSYEPPPNYDDVVKMTTGNVTGDFWPVSSKEPEIKKN